MAQWFTKEEQVSSSDLDKTHNLVRAKPFDNPKLSYSIMLPKTWVYEGDLGKQQVGVARLTPLGTFAEKQASDTAVVQVSFAMMPVEVSLVDWLGYEAEKNKVKMIDWRWVEFGCGRAVYAFGEFAGGGRVFTNRMLVFADDGKIFIASSFVQSQRWESVMPDLAIAMRSIKLLQPTGVSRLEPWLQLAGGEPKYIVVYPASWKPRPVMVQVKGKSGLDLTLAKDEQLLGYVRVKAMDPAVCGRATDDRKLKTSEEEMSESGVKLTSSWTDDTTITALGVQGLARALKASGKLGDASVEIGVAIVDRAPLEFVVTRLGVERAADIPLWMRTRRAFEIALLTMSSV